MQQKPTTDINRFLKKFALLAIVLLLLDFSIGALLRHLYFKQKFNDVTYVFNKTRAQTLVFGSSRAMHQYVSKTFEAKLNTTFYNCGREGYKLIYNLAAMSAVLERYKPRQIILDIYPDEFATSEEGNLSLLLPYHDNAAIKPFIKYNSKFEDFKMLSAIYPYNALMDNILSETIHPTRVNPDTTDGYAKLSSVLEKHPMLPFKHEQAIASRIALLDSILNDLNKKDVDITLVVSPIYFSFGADDNTIAILTGFSKKYPNVHFISYENNPSFTDASLFYDDYHLNDKGAHAFSVDLANRLLERK